MVVISKRTPDIFGAISHPARRKMLDLLRDAELSDNAIATHLGMSRAVVSKQLRILLDAGLVTEERDGRDRRYQFDPERLAPVRDWLAQSGSSHPEEPTPDAPRRDDRLQRMMKLFSEKSRAWTPPSEELAPAPDRANDPVPDPEQTAP
jgi:DNA-binding transcriptional ArsR family regulator